MHTEIERKFIVTDSTFKQSAVRIMDIRQGYVGTSSNGEAIQFIDNADRIIEIQEFLGGDTIVISYEDADNPYMYIETLEGTMKASVGDYIIKGVNGEFYPCKPDIFEKTYEEVAE